MVWFSLLITDKSVGCTKILNDSKWIKTSRNEVMPPTTSNNDSQPIVPYNVHTQAGFDTPFIKRRGFIPLGISEMSLTFFSICKRSR